MTEIEEQPKEEHKESSDEEPEKDKYLIPDGVKQHYKYIAYGANSEGVIYSLKYDRTIKKHIDKQGYEYVCVRLNGKTHNLRVNIFIYECFNGSGFNIHYRYNT